MYINQEHAFNTIYDAIKAADDRIASNVAHQIAVHLVDAATIISMFPSNDLATPEQRTALVYNSVTAIQAGLEAFSESLTHAKAARQARIQLENELKTWGLAFSNELERYGLYYINTSYSAWEYSKSGLQVSIPYVLGEFKSAVDFRVYLIDYSQTPCLLGEYATVKDLIEAMNKIKNLFHLTKPEETVSI